MNVFIVHSALESIALGFIIFFGFMLLWFKFPRPLKLWTLRHPLITDLFVSGIVMILHWGTVSGTMGATVAGILTALFTSIMKIGYRNALRN